MKKVLHIVEYLYQGGIERLLQQIATHTPEAPARLCFYAYQVDSKSGMAGELEKTGVPLYLYNKGGGYDFNLLKALIAVVEKHDIQTIHTHDFGPMEYAVALKLRFPRLKLIHTHHSLHYFLRFPRYIRFFQLFSLFYSKIICVSDHVKDTLGARCPLSRGKLVTIPNGVALETFSDQTGPLSNPLRLVNVSRVSPEKNLIKTLEACRELKNAGINFVFHHAGSGDPEEESKLRDFVAVNQLEGNVHFHGFLSDVRKVLALGDIFVSTSLTEGHPVAVLEAMASGKLCVVSDIPPHRQISSDALVFFQLEGSDLFQKLKTVAESPAVYEVLREKAKEEVAQKFSMERMIASYLKMYA